MLTPPSLGQPAADLWAMIRAGDLGPYWSTEVQAALAPTFVEDASGAVRSRLGLERHLLVLDGLLDVDPAQDLDRCEADGTPVWAVVCQPVGAGMDQAAGWHSV
jgi:hypothetical protein